MKTKRDIDRLLDEAHTLLQLPINSVPDHANPHDSYVNFDQHAPDPASTTTGDLPIGVYARRHKRRPVDDDEVFTLIMAVLER